MTHKHFFQWNIPENNHYVGRTDAYLNIVASWDDKQLYEDGSPMVFIDLINPTLYTCLQIKDWYQAERQIKEVARIHFAYFAKDERIKRARAVLMSEGESNIPTLDRYEVDLLTQETLSYNR